MNATLVIDALILIGAIFVTVATWKIWLGGRR